MYKGVARGGQMGQQPHPGMSLPHLGGAAGQRWGSRFSGQLKKSYKDNWKISFKGDKIYKFV